jgi:hypothetical protein
MYRHTARTISDTIPRNRYHISLDASKMAAKVVQSLDASKMAAEVGWPLDVSKMATEAG